jgi:hypothetical protein
MTPVTGPARGFWPATERDGHFVQKIVAINAAATPGHTNLGAIRGIG